MVDAQAGIPLPALAAIVPEGEGHTLLVHLCDGIGPALGQDGGVYRARLWLQQRVVAPSVGLVDVGIGRHNVPVTQQHHGVATIPQLLRAQPQALEPAQLVVEFGAGLRVAVGEVQAGVEYAVDGGFYVACLLVRRVAGQCGDHRQGLMPARQQGHTVPRALAHHYGAIARRFDGRGGELRRRAFELL